MALKDKIEEFVRHYLKPYPPDTKKSKFVHDPVWGTIEILSHECCILDSPLLQRLRQIHQTGFVNATFPSATHTRFEHTIGVMHLAGRIATTLQARYRDADEKTKQKVRLAALMHDTGHAAFSHTTEEIYDSRFDLRELVGKGGEFEGKGAGEVLSYLIATSESFKTFYYQIRQNHRELEVDIEDFAPLILGRARPEKQFEAEIISGPIDADKLDYFPRDGRAAGIELAVDIERLLHCLGIAPEVRGGVTFQTMVVSRGGYNAIQQLLFARATLFATVYHHHKVRACDCMVKAVFEYFSNEGLKFKKNNASGGFSMDSAADFLHITDSDFFAEAYSHSPESEPHQLIHDILYRRLFQRILTVGRNTIQNFDDPSQRAGYAEFYNLRSKPRSELRQLVREIISRAKVNVDAHDVWLDIPRDPSFKKAGEARVNLSPRNGTPRLIDLQTVIPIVEWMSTYSQYYAQSFLFGPPDLAIRTKLAAGAVEVLNERFDLKFNADAFAEGISY
ncbi:MAG TPA: HD domain-containing protein [Candidatus Acidoferrum sp.]|jgi:HD superfamily phosphohydrolase|nr:HD domain-containing protein [Candidatus Acidoferrum sp.]